MNADNSTLTDEPVSIAPDVEEARETLHPSRPRLSWLIWPGAALFAALVYTALGHLMDALTHESTDDAFIEGHIVSIAPRISGQVAAVRVADNQWVKQGEPLVEIDPRDYEMRLKQKRASMRTIEANFRTVSSAFELMKAKVDTAEASARQARAEADATEAMASRAEADFKRDEQLLGNGAISRQEFDHAQAEAREAEAKSKADEQKAAEETSKVAEARAQLAAARTAVEMAAAQVKQAETDVSAAELDLSYATIQAPRDGRVTRKAVEAGSYIQTGQTLLSLVPTDLWVLANFKETQLAQMRPGQPAEIAIEALPKQRLRGHVDSIQAGSGSRFSLLPPENAVGNFVKVVQRVPVKIVFDERLNSSHAVGPGMSVFPRVRVKDAIVQPWALALISIVVAAGAAFAVELAVSRANEVNPPRTNPARRSRSQIGLTKDGHG